LQHQVVVRHTESHRTVLRVDQDSACGYAGDFASGLNWPDTIRYTTAITFSTRMLSALKTGQDEDLVWWHFDGAGMGGWMHRVEAHPVDFPIILNDQRVTLPALHLQCDTAHYAPRPTGPSDAPLMTCDFLVLNDPQDPVVLVWREMRYGSSTVWDTTSRAWVPRPLVNGGRPVDTTKLQVIRIFYAGVDSSSAATAEQQMEQSLMRDRKVVIYGIYFDYASADIKKESEPVLREIGTLMQKNPTWTLSINGHTDSIGGSAYNQDLSNRRAAAVKDALVTRYHIAATRLTSAGYGLSQPVETNTTLEGRARNRRVELVRVE
jgi:outer membrane protein OmpA-like peptidoglycan-associated protein